MTNRTTKSATRRKTHTRVRRSALALLLFGVFAFPNGAVAATNDIFTVAGNGVRGSSGDGGLATNAQLNSPRAVAATANGGYLIADPVAQRVRRVSPAGRITTVAGTGVGGFSGDGGPATSAQLGTPIGVAATSDGG